MTSWTSKRSDEPLSEPVPIGRRKGQTERGHRGTVVTYAAVLVGASAVFAVMMLTSTPTSAAPESNTGSGGMPVSSSTPTSSAHEHVTEHGPADQPTSSPTPTMAGDMPGMDHGSSGGDGHGSSPSPTTSVDGHGTEHGSADKPGAGTGHGDAAEAAPDRPVAAVLGTFGGASSAVMLSAVFLRRKDRALREAKAAARAARRSQK